MKVGYRGISIGIWIARKVRGRTLERHGEEIGGESVVLCLVMRHRERKLSLRAKGGEVR